MISCAAVMTFPWLPPKRVSRILQNFHMRKFKKARGSQKHFQRAIAAEGMSAKTVYYFVKSADGNSINR
ncbi:MAG: hypothetical protein ABR97_01065 [Rhodobacter sp. BACL10 MAG-120419-bin15]|nr:MAG: hypothetical protein ABR97_01065 [Rhodobacter sp. BACL10 MAG-120419-bin15]